LGSSLRSGFGYWFLRLDARTQTPSTTLGWLRLADPRVAGLEPGTCCTSASPRAGRIQHTVGPHACG
jgi:hypothetical protein